MYVIMLYRYTKQSCINCAIWTKRKECEKTIEEIKKRMEKAAKMKPGKQRNKLIEEIYALAIEAEIPVEPEDDYEDNLEVLEVFLKDMEEGEQEI